MNDHDFTCPKCGKENKVIINGACIECRKAFDAIAGRVGDAHDLMVAKKRIRELELRTMRTNIMSIVENARFSEKFYDVAKKIKQGIKMKFPTHNKGQYVMLDLNEPEEIVRFYPEDGPWVNPYVTLMEFLSMPLAHLYVVYEEEQ